jgi:DNA integrity scanning protein DisA with diadenylate cyclase activity
VLKAALAAAEESSADLRSQIETLRKGLERASKREIVNSQELATLRSYHQESEMQRQELTPRPVRLLAFSPWRVVSQPSLHVILTIYARDLML